MLTEALLENFNFRKSICDLTEGQIGSCPFPYKFNGTAVLAEVMPISQAACID